jgi:hypothetical protein
MVSLRQKISFGVWVGSLVLAANSYAKENKITKFPTTVQATNVDHKLAYSPKPERGSHLDVKVTPPEIRGKEGRVMIEVYNRGKDHLALVMFDVTLFNQGGLDISAPVKAEDLKPNMSGGQWVIIPAIQGKFPTITGARLSNLRIVNNSAREVKMKTYMDLVKK